MGEFTSGPWHVEGLEVLHEQPARHRWEHESIAEVAEHYDEHRQHSAETVAQAIANAQLMAAAPDLYAALKAVEFTYDIVYDFLECPWCQGPRNGKHKDDCQRQAAIAKAEGNA